MKQIDVHVTDCGSVVMFNLATGRAQKWAKKQVETPWGGSWNGACEKRYAESLTLGMIDDGLRVTVGGFLCKRGTGDYSDCAVRA